MPLPRSGCGRGRGRESSAVPPPTRGRGRDRGSPAVPPPTRGRGSPAVPPPTRGRDRGSLAVPPPTRGRDRADSLFDDILLPGRSSAVYFDVPVAGGREVMSVDCQEQRTLCEEQHVGSSASAQMPHPDGLQHLDFSCLPYKRQHLAEPASAQTLHKLDVLSLEDLRYTRTMEGLSTTTASLSSLRDTIEASPPSGRSLSSSPIWEQCDFLWAITFYTIKDLRGYFHTFPHVGGPFQSKDEANKAIDRYIADQEDLTMGMGLSEVDKLIQDYLYFPDGTKRSLKAGEPIDKRRDTTYQLVQAVVYKYNDHHNLFGDLAYEVKDVLDGPSTWEEENYRMYTHINFTAKTKGSYGFDTGSDYLFFAEVTYVRGDDELVVNCCCMVNPFDNGPCLGCGTTMKHPNGSVYTGGRMNASYSRPFGTCPVKATWVHEDSDKEVERLREMFGGAPATACVPLEA